MGEIAGRYTSSTKFESSRVGYRVGLDVKKPRSSTRTSGHMLLDSIVSLSQFLLDFTRLLPLTRPVECIYTFLSQDTRGSSCLNQLELEKIEYRVGHSRKNSPIADGYLNFWITVKGCPSLTQCHPILNPWWMCSEGHLFPFFVLCFKPKMFFRP